MGKKSLLRFFSFTILGYSQNLEKRKAVYAKTCIACYQVNEAGILGAFPSLASSDFLKSYIN
jgi:hypothetical protein